MWGFQQKAIQPALDTCTLQGTESIGNRMSAVTKPGSC